MLRFLYFFVVSSRPVYEQNAIALFTTGETLKLHSPLLWDDLTPVVDCSIADPQLASDYSGCSEVLENMGFFQLSHRVEAFFKLFKFTKRPMLMGVAISVKGR